MPDKKPSHLPARTKSELRKIIGKIPESAEELDEAHITLIKKCVHAGMTDQERAKFEHLKAALDSLEPLPHANPEEWAEMERLLGGLE